MDLRPLAEESPADEFTFPTIDPRARDGEEDRYRYVCGPRVSPNHLAPSDASDEPALATLLEDRYETIQQTLVCLGIGCYLNLLVTLVALL